MLANSPVEKHTRQMETILTAWGMPSDNAKVTAEVLTYADIHGVASHGISMLTDYNKIRQAGRYKLDAKPSIVRETPVSALVDGNGGLGHVPARFAMELAIAKARDMGVGVVSVRNSAHFGACGYYSRMASDVGMIGIVATSASRIRIPPTGAREARLGTDPFSFAAPSADGRPFLLDMATTTVAGGKVRNKLNEDLPCPPGWILDNQGRPTTDPRDVLERGGFLTSLGGTAEGASYKGYGLSAMVNILSACLSGATLITDPMHLKQPKGMDISHFILALSPTLFRDEGEFEADVSAFCNALRATPAVDPEQPVMVAGDPERAIAAKRMVEGIPIPPGLKGRVKVIAQEAGVPWLLD